MALNLIYKLSRELRVATVYPTTLPSIANREAFGVDLTEADLILMLSDLQGVSAYDPNPRTGEL
jgi:hypothetical protein